MLRPIWTDIPETARRVRQRISLVMRSAVAYEWIAYDPAGSAITAALPKMPGTKAHQRSIPYAEVPGALSRVADSGATLASKMCLRFVVLTATRSGEARGARWDEIDADAGVWTVPAERMKGGHAHRVPLARQALDVLNEARVIDDESGLIFPSPLKPGNPLSDGTPLGVLKDLEINSSVHGFRTSCRQFALEKTDASWAVAEAVLAHTLGDAVEQAYIRGADPFDERRRLMQEWADFCIPSR